MAIPLNHCFDYEISIAAANHGGFAGSAVSAQEREGALPGMLGSTPKLAVNGDELRLQALPEQLPSAKAWELLFVVLFPLHNRWIDRQLRRATVRAIRLTAPGLGSVLRVGQTLRLQLQFEPNAGAGSVPCVDVSLSQAETVVQRWTGLPMQSDPLQ